MEYLPISLIILNLQLSILNRNARLHIKVGSSCKTLSHIRSVSDGILKSKHCLEAISLSHLTVPIFRIRTSKLIEHKSNCFKKILAVLAITLSPKGNFPIVVAVVL